MINDLKILAPFISRSDKIALIKVFLLTLVNSFSEFASLGSFVAALALVINGSLFENIPFFGAYVAQIGLSERNLQLLFILFFMVIVVISIVARLILTKIQINTSINIGCDISSKLFFGALTQNYELQKSINSSELHANSKKAYELSSNLILPILTIFSGLIIGLFILVALANLSILLVFFSFSLIATFYIIFSLSAKKKITKNSQNIALQVPLLTKLIQEATLGLRDLILNQNRSRYVRLYDENLRRLYSAVGSNQILTLVPRFYIELIIFIFLSSLLCFFVLHNYPMIDLLPMLGGFILGVQRLLPLCQQIYNSFTIIRGYRSSNQDAINALKMYKEINQNWSPSEKSRKDFEEPEILELKKVYFKYQTSNTYAILDGNLILKKGELTGIIGKSGSGKSTLMDLAMGLIFPTKGKVFLNKSKITPNNAYLWHNTIGHVPQEIFLTDDSIFNNITMYSVPRDEEQKKKVEKILLRVGLLDLLKKLPNGIDTNIGERGGMLSGGERQRIGLARALFKKPKFLFLDEATSGLDSDSENKIIELLKSFKDEMGIVVISHKNNIADNCDVTFKIESGEISKL